MKVGLSIMGTRRVAVVVATAGLLWSMIGKASPSVPLLLTEQGRLTDAKDVPITKSTKLKFNIYAVATGGTTQWTEVQTLTPDAGYFSVELGSVTPFPSGLFTGAELFLGVTVESDPEMKPRQAITSVPYALVANNAIGDITPSSVKTTGNETVGGNLAVAGSVTSGGAPVGVVQTLETETSASPALSFSETYLCQTTAYTPATSGQTALIWVDISADSVPSGSGLGVKVAYNTGTDNDLTFYHYMQNTGASTGEAHAAQFGVLSLTAGVPYIFENGVISSTGAGYTSSVYCNTVVEIVTAPLSGGPIF